MEDNTWEMAYDMCAKSRHLWMNKAEEVLDALQDLYDWHDAKGGKNNAEYEEAIANAAKLLGEYRD